MKVCTAAIAALSLLAGTASAQWGEQKSTPNVVETAASAGSFNTLLAAAKAAGLADTLATTGPITVFAPTDEAFAKLGTTVNDLLKPENKGLLTSILTYHVVSGEVKAEQVVGLSFAETLNGQRVDITTANGGVMIDNANVVQTDIDAENGVIHVIDAVLMPATDNIAEVATGAGMFNTLLAAAKAAGLVPALTGDGPLTVLAPTDEAFAALGTETIEDLLRPANKQKLADILKYHVISGRVYSDQALEAGEAATLQGGEVTFAAKWGKAKVNNANLVKTDIEASNGVVHVIDTVLLPH